MSYLSRRAFSPPYETEFYCADCDHNKVNSTKPDTGNFYVVFGHRHNGNNNYDHHDYEGVMFALCGDCNK